MTKPISGQIPLRLLPTEPDRLESLSSLSRICTECSVQTSYQDNSLQLYPLLSASTLSLVWRASWCPCSQRMDAVQWKLWPTSICNMPFSDRRSKLIVIVDQVPATEGVVFHQRSPSANSMQEIDRWWREGLQGPPATKFLTPGTWSTGRSTHG